MVVRIPTRGTVLLVGLHAILSTRLRDRLLREGFEVREAPTADDTEGLGVHLVVVDSGLNLSDVRVHPRLHEVPVVLIAPQRSLKVEHWSSSSVWPVTSPPSAIVSDTVAAVRRMLPERVPAAV